MSPSSPRKVLVVGANRGIGLALCKRFKALGREVIAAGRRSSSALDALGARVELGVELGQLLVVGLVLPIVVTSARRSPRAFERWGLQLGSGLIGAFGAIWLVARLISR